MAIALVGKHTSSGSGTAVSDTHGLSISSGDVVVCLVHSNGSVTIADNNGATSMTEDIEAAGASSNTYAIYSRVAGASEPAAYAFTLSGSQTWSVQTRVYSGVDNTTHWDVAPSGDNDASGTGTTATATSITTTADGALAIYFGVSDAADTTGWSDPTNGFGDELEASGGRSTVTYTKTIASAGAVGNTAATLSTSDDWLVLLAALAPEVVIEPEAEEPSTVTSRGQLDRSVVSLTVGEEATGASIIAANLTSGTTSLLDDCSWPSSSVGFVVGAAGDVVRTTTDSGASWSSVATGIAGGNWVECSFVSTTVGWVCGNSDKIGYTANGGTSWTAVPVGVAKNWSTICFASTTVGWVGSSTGEIYKTTNAGSSWSAQTSGVATGMDGSDFIDVNTGWMVGHSGVILKTTDGGTNWTAQSSGATGTLFSVDAYDANNAVVVGQYGQILTTTDGGTTWTPRVSGTIETFYDVKWLNPSDIIAVSNGHLVAYSSNAGVTWSLKPWSYSLFGVSALTSSLACVCGYNGGIATFTFSPPTGLIDLTPTARSVKFTNASPGGFGSCSFDITGDAFRPLANEVKRGAWVRLCAGSTTLYEGYIVDVVRKHGSEDVWTIECGGLLEAAKQRKDYCRTWVDADTGQWTLFPNANPQGGFDNNGQVLLAFAKGTDVKGESSGGTPSPYLYGYYWLNGGLSYNSDEYITKVTFSRAYDVTGATWYGLVRTQIDNPWGANVTDILSVTNTSSGSGSTTTSSGAGARAVNIYLYASGDVTALASDRFLQLTDVRVYATPDGAGRRVDECMSEVALTSGLADTADTDTIGDDLTHAVIRPFKTRAEALAELAALHSAPVEWGFWADRTFRCRARPTAPDNRQHWYCFDRSDAGITWQVDYDDENTCEYVCVVYATVGHATYPDGTVTKLYRHRKDDGTYETAEPASPIDRCHVLDWSSKQMSATEAANTGDQYLTLNSQNGWNGTVQLDAGAKLRTVDGIEITPEFIQAGDWIECLSELGHEPLYITSVSVDLDARTVALGIGEVDVELVQAEPLYVAGAYVPTPDEPGEATIYPEPVEPVKPTTTSTTVNYGTGNPYKKPSKKKI